MANFNEHALEMSIMELFKDEGYTYVSGDHIHRERTEVLLTDDLKQYLYNRYAKDGITPSEVDSVILMLRNISGTIYEANKAVFKLLCDGFILNREDRTQKDLYIELIDFDTPENNIFKVVNQFEIEGVNNQLRIPDGIVFVNGIPVVVLEFKSAVQENTTIMDAYKQLTIRYRRDIPEIFKYNAFVVISDGANNKYGSFFSPYDFFYAWRKINSDDKELDGINSLVTMVKGLFRKDRLLEVIKDFIYFPDNSDKDLKIVCRYPQFFAANKLYENIKAHLRPEGDGKGGTYFGATGCGKSYTMLFLTRMLMKSKYFSSPTILIITDRTDLDDQLSKQFVGSKKFEQFSRALLTKMGVEFTNKGVQVSNDGGIDGYGYHVDADDFRTTRVVIQCKRFNSNPVSEPDINQFLGAMNKYQADYGVFITNSRFTNKAREAAREGTPITLIDGNDLIRLVIKYELYITPVTTYVLDGFYTED